ncbi:hypothetical protein [Nocardioides aestuarii]|uniref:Uncharacterized protein n=1 Tax=Nocardioides aestuarii TaxID=252231 RepID=A0ABW4TK84_9ACTN
MSVLVWLLVALLRLSGSGPATAPDDVAPPEPPAAAEAFPDDLGPVRTQAQIEQRFLTRSPIAACDLAVTGGSAAPRPGSFDCLQAAADAGDEAELIVTSELPDGRYAVYYRVNPGGPLEIFVDRREAAGKDWDYRRCPLPDDISTSTCD